ncbi:hypothetical protein GWK47_019635 [Chionoecetes opilio]|uniref:Uncharacterized protein n=1 Tax=Chionoecetes opilio TaxID=41210 RepID=A0A8J5CIR9_CHIOP|nr:hypothetical protein GWK47_019635 [Chionoecetes opilio]
MTSQDVLSLSLAGILGLGEGERGALVSQRSLDTAADWRMVESTAANHLASPVVERAIVDSVLWKLSADRNSRRTWGQYGSRDRSKQCRYPKSVVTQGSGGPAVIVGGFRARGLGPDAMGTTWSLPWLRAPVLGLTNFA